jgi:excisionase family DNA binding protein
MATAKENPPGNPVQGLPKDTSSSLSRKERLLSAQEVAHLLAVPLSTLYGWRYKGTGPRAYRVGKHLRYRGSDVGAWLETVADDPARR